MTDTLPLWFWLPLAIVLWTTLGVMCVAERRAVRAEIEAEAERIESWNWGPGA